MPINDFSRSFADTEVDVAAELDAQRVEVGVGPFDGRAIDAPEERDLDSRQAIGIGQQIPGLAAVAREGRVAEIDRRDDIELADVRIRLRLRLTGGRRLVEVDRGHQKLGRHLQRRRHQEKSCRHTERSTVRFGLLTESDLGLGQAIDIQRRVGAGEIVLMVGVEERLPVRLRRVRQQQPPHGIGDRFGRAHADLPRDTGRMLHVALSTLG